MVNRKLTGLITSNECNYPCIGKTFLEKIFAKVNIMCTLVRLFHASYQEFIITEEESVLLYNRLYKYVV